MICCREHSRVTKVLFCVLLLSQALEGSNVVLSKSERNAHETLDFHVGYVVGNWIEQSAVIHVAEAVAQRANTLSGSDTQLVVHYLGVSNCTYAGGVEMARRAVAAQVSVLVTCVCSVDAQAASPILVAASIPQIGAYETSDDMKQNLYPYFRRTIPADNQEWATVSSLVKSFTWDQIGIIWANEAWAKGISQTALQMLQGLNVHVKMHALQENFGDSCNGCHGGFGHELSASDEQRLNQVLDEWSRLQIRVFFVIGGGFDQYDALRNIYSHPKYAAAGNTNTNSAIYCISDGFYELLGLIRQVHVESEGANLPLPQYMATFLDELTGIVSTRRVNVPRVKSVDVFEQVGHTHTHDTLAWSDWYKQWLALPAQQSVSRDPTIEVIGPFWADAFVSISKALSYHKQQQRYSRYMTRTATDGHAAHGSDIEERSSADAKDVHSRSLPTGLQLLNALDSVKFIGVSGEMNLATPKLVEFDIVNQVQRFTRNVGTSLRGELNLVSGISWMGGATVRAKVHRIALVSWNAFPAAKQAVRLAIQQVNNANFLGDGDILMLLDEHQIPEDCENPDPEMIRQRVQSAIDGAAMAVLGAHCSSTTANILSVTTPLGVPTIGFSARRSSLGDSNKYPLFIRTTFSKQTQIQTLVAAVAAVGWKHVLVRAEPDEISASTLIVDNELAQLGVIAEIVLGPSETAIPDAVKSTRRSCIVFALADAQVIIGDIVALHRRGLLKQTALLHTDAGFSFLNAFDSFAPPDMKNNANLRDELLHGALQLSWPYRDNAGSAATGLGRDFELQGWSISDFIGLADFAHDAVWLLAHGILHSKLMSLPLSGANLIESMRNVQMQGASGALSFTGGGGTINQSQERGNDRLSDGARWVLVNVQQGKPVQLTRSLGTTFDQTNATDFGLDKIVFPSGDHEPPLPCPDGSIYKPVVMPSGFGRAACLPCPHRSFCVDGVSHDCLKDHVCPMAAPTAIPMDVWNRTVFHTTALSGYSLESTTPLAAIIMASMVATMAIFLCSIGGLDSLASRSTNKLTSPSLTHIESKSRPQPQHRRESFKDRIARSNIGRTMSVVTRVLSTIDLFGRAHFAREGSAVMYRKTMQGGIISVLLVIVAVFLTLFLIIRDLYVNPFLVNVQVDAGVQNFAKVVTDERILRAAFTFLGIDSMSKSNCLTICDGLSETVTVLSQAPDDIDGDNDDETTAPKADCQSFSNDRNHTCTIKLVIPLRLNTDIGIGLKLFGGRARGLIWNTSTTIAGDDFLLEDRIVPPSALSGAANGGGVLVGEVPSEVQLLAQPTFITRRGAKAGGFICSLRSSVPGSIVSRQAYAHNHSIADGMNLQLHVVHSTTVENYTYRAVFDIFDIIATVAGFVGTAVMSCATFLLQRLERRDDNKLTSLLVRASDDCGSKNSDGDGKVRTESSAGSNDGGKHVKGYSSDETDMNSSRGMVSTAMRDGAYTGHGTDRNDEDSWASEDDKPQGKGATCEYGVSTGDEAWC